MLVVLSVLSRLEDPRNLESGKITAMARIPDEKVAIRDCLPRMPIPEEGAPPIKKRPRVSGASLVTAQARTEKQFQTIELATNSFAS